MRVELANGAVLNVDPATNLGTYSDDIRSQAVKLLSPGNPDTLDGMLIQRVSDGAIFQQHGSREVRQNVSTRFDQVPPNLEPYRGNRIRYRNSFMNRGPLRAIAIEWQPGPGAGWVLKKANVPPPPQNNIQPWMLPSGGFLAPQGANQEVVLLDVEVPTNVRMRLKAHVQFLETGSTNEDFYIWILRIGGMDILNPFVSDAKTGRIVRSNGQVVDFGRQIEDLPILSPGTRIQYVVRGVGALAANTDTIACSLIGTMWGDKGE